MGKRLAWYLVIIAALQLLAACADMKVIGDAAMREFKADGISVEWTASRGAAKSSQTVSNPENGS